MRREERFMNILGGLDEKYVALAMPSSCGHSTIGDTGNVVYAQPSEDNTEVSKKDLRIYWITRALGMAAALALVVGGGVWLWKNWDKIAVSGNNRPGEVTSITEAPVVTSSITTSDISVSDSTDIFEQITDTSMPEPFSEIRDLEKFDLQWTARLYNIPDGFYKDGIAEWENSVRSNETPYTLYDNYNLANYIKKFGITADEIEEKLREHNAQMQEYLDEAEKSGTERSERTAEYIRHFIYTDEEINTLKSGDEAAIAELFISDNSILLKEQNYVISPMWLYYHTIEDYKAIGITPVMLHTKMSQYKEIGLTDEAWRAFCQKYYAFYFDLDRNSSAVNDLTIFDMPNDPVLDEQAFYILEEYFYGEWKISEDNEYSIGTITLKYDSSQDYHFNLLAVFEYDDMYILNYGSGGIGNCYFIKKDEPDVMYWTEIGFGFGNTVVTSSLDSMAKYTERTDPSPRLNVGGEISPLGEKYLVYKYGDEFGKVYTNTLDVYSVTMNTVVFEDEGGSLYLANGYTSSDITRYLIAMSDNAVTLRVPYVRDPQELTQTPEYFDVTLTKNDNGEWSVSYAKSETYTAGYSFNGVEIPDELITEDGEGYIRAAAVFIVSPTDGALSIVKSGDELGGLIVEECSSTFFKNEDNTLEYGDCRARLSGEIEASGFLRIDRQNIDETYGRNGGIEFIPADADFPMFYSDHHNEKMTGNSVFIGSIFDSSEYYIGDEYAEKLTNYSDSRVTVKLKDISISMAVNEADSSKATLTDIEGL